MAFGEHKSGQTIWAVLLLAMGILLLFKTPYALKSSGDHLFLNFARYFIALFLIVGGLKKLYVFYIKKPHIRSEETRSDKDGDDSVSKE